MVVVCKDVLFILEEPESNLSVSHVHQGCWMAAFVVVTRLVLLTEAWLVSMKLSVGGVSGVDHSAGLLVVAITETSETC